MNETGRSFAALFLRRPAPCRAGADRTVFCRAALYRAVVFGALTLGAVWSQACASSLATSAKQDDLPAFKSALQSADKPLSDDTLVEVARAVAQRELLSMPPEAAVSRVTELRACAAELAGTFRELSQRDDVVGAVATQVLLDEGLWKGERTPLIERHATSTNAEWRAVAARAATERKYGPWRRTGFLDGDLRVRRAALLAARDARSSNDVDALVEAARLDPDPVARKFALQASSAIADADALARLRDVWTHAEPSTRREIVFAWGRKEAFANGGHAQLGWVLATQGGIPRLAAAVVLLQRGWGDNPAEPAVNLDAVAAEGVLVRAFSDGATDEKQFVAEYAPRTPAVVDAFARGLKSSDEQTQVSAARVLIASTAWRDAAKQRLTALLGSKSPEIAVQARDALAAALAPEVKASLRERLSSSDPTERLEAATQLLVYRRAGDRDDGVELLLADPDAAVRTALACSVIERLGR